MAEVEAGGDERPDSLYRRIIADIRGKIVSGEWAPGHRLPFEEELAAQYGCSRMTANKAMSDLARAGLIERRRRSGSFVRRPQSQAAILEIHDIRIEVEALGLLYRYELAAHRTRKAGAADTRTLGVARGTPLVELTCRHFAAGDVFCLEERIIDLSVVTEATAQDFSTVSPGPWLIARVPWSAAEHTISAEAAGERAAALGVSKGTACLVVSRRTWSGERPVTHVRLTYPGASHSLVARFAPLSA